MASITKYTTSAGKDRWRVSVYVGIDPRTGRKKYIGKRGFDSKQKAALIAARLEVAVAEGSIEKAKPKKITFRQVYDEWFDEYAASVRQSTLVVTKTFFKNHILKSFEKYLISAITEADIRKAVRRWAASSKVAYRRWFSFTQQIFKYAVEHGYINDDPTRLVKPPKVKGDTTSDADKFWSKEEVEQFLNCIDPAVDLEKYVVFRLYCLSGLRRAELLALHFDDIDFEASTITVARTLSQAEHGKAIIQPPKTKASNRTIPLDETTMTWLKKWKGYLLQQQLYRGINALSGEGIVFPTAKGGYKSLNTPRRWLVKIIEDNGFRPISLHKLRHSYISNLLLSGAPVSAVQKLVGHASPYETLQVYSHVNLEAKKKAADGLAKYLDL